MGTSERMYTLACECHDLEERYDRVAMELSHVRDHMASLHRAAGEVLDTLEGCILTDRALKAVDELRAFIVTV